MLVSHRTWEGTDPPRADCDLPVLPPDVPLALEHLQGPPDLPAAVVAADGEVGKEVLLGHLPGFLTGFAAVEQGQDDQDDLGLQ